MSTIISNIVKQFGNSKPIFVGNINENRRTIEFCVKDKYNPINDPNLDLKTPVEKLAGTCYRESYRRRQRCFQRDNSEDSVYSMVISALCSVLNKYSEYKNAKGSKVYRWIKYSHVQSQYSDGIVLLYNYLQSQRNNSDVFDGGKNNPHVKNVIAILERMRDKYDR
jgi:hypothetical protein